MRVTMGHPISHAEALQHCKELAAKLLGRSSEPQTLPPGAPPVTPLTCEEGWWWGAGVRGGSGLRPRRNCPGRGACPVGGPSLPVGPPLGVPVLVRPSEASTDRSTQAAAPVAWELARLPACLPPASQQASCGQLLPLPELLVRPTTPCWGEPHCSPAWVGPAAPLPCLLSPPLTHSSLPPPHSHLPRIPLQTLSWRRSCRQSRRCSCSPWCRPTPTPFWFSPPPSPPPPHQRLRRQQRLQRRPPPQPRPLRPAPPPPLPLASCPQLSRQLPLVRTWWGTSSEAALLPPLLLLRPAAPVAARHVPPPQPPAAARPAAAAGMRAQQAWRAWALLLPPLPQQQLHQPPLLRSPRLPPPQAP